MDNYNIHVKVTNCKTLAKQKSLAFERVLNVPSPEVDYQSIVNGLLAMYPAGYKITIEIQET